MSQRSKAAHTSPASCTTVTQSAASGRGGKEAAAAPKEHAVGRPPNPLSAKVTTAKLVSAPADVRPVALMPVASVLPVAAHAPQAKGSAKGSAVLESGVASKSAPVARVAAKGAVVPLPASGKFGIVFGLGGLVMAGHAPSNVAASIKAGNPKQPASHGPAQSSVAGQIAGTHGRQGEAQSANKRKQRPPAQC